MKKLLISASFLYVSMNAAHSVMFVNGWKNIAEQKIDFVISATPLYPYSENIPTNFKNQPFDQVDMQGFFEEIQHEIKKDPEKKPVTLKIWAGMLGSALGTFCTGRDIIIREQVQDDNVKVLCFHKQQLS